MKYVSRCFALSLSILLSGSIALAQAAPTTAKIVAPIQLKPTSNAPITLHMVDDSRTIYQSIGKMVGINVLFDPDYASKRVPVDLTNVSFSDALRIVGEISNTFYKPVTSDAIFVASNTITKHHEFDVLFDQTFYLHNVSMASDANEISTAIRNVLPPDAKTYLVISQNALAIQATADQISLAQKLIGELDRPRKSYRLTFTVSEIDGNKRISTRQYTLVAVDGQQTTLKQGSKVPVVTGTYNPTATDTKPAGVQSQYTYLDVGMNFDATLTAVDDGAIMKTNIEQSSVAPEPSGVGPQDPIFIHTSVRGTFQLSLHKPLLLGSLAIPASSHHLDIEATLDPLP